MSCIEAWVAAGKKKEIVRFLLHNTSRRVVNNWREHKKCPAGEESDKFMKRLIGCLHEEKHKQWSVVSGVHSGTQGSLISVTERSTKISVKRTLWPVFRKGFGWIRDMETLTSVFNAKLLSCQITIRLKDGYFIFIWFCTTDVLVHWQAWLRSFLCDKCSVFPQQHFFGISTDHCQELVISD